jgi:hypothetical protein
MIEKIWTKVYNIPYFIILLLLFSCLQLRSFQAYLRSINEYLSKEVRAEVQRVLELSGNKYTSLTTATRFVVMINAFLACYM